MTTKNCISIVVVMIIAMVVLSSCPMLMGDVQLNQAGVRMSSSTAPLANVRSKASAASATAPGSASIVKALYTWSMSMHLASFKQGFSYSANDQNLNYVLKRPAPDWVYFPVIEQGSAAVSRFVKNGKSIDILDRNGGNLRSRFTRDFISEFREFRVDAIELALDGIGAVVGNTLYTHGYIQGYSAAELRSYLFRHAPEYSSYKIEEGRRPLFKDEDGKVSVISNLCVVFMRDDWLDSPVFLTQELEESFRSPSRDLSDLESEKISSYLNTRERGLYAFIPYDLVTIPIVFSGVNKDSVEGRYIQNPVIDIVFDFNKILHETTIDDYNEDQSIDESDGGVWGLYYKVDHHAPFGISVRIINE